MARDVSKSLANFTDFSFGEKKRFLSEVIQKIKVDSKNEVHLIMRTPQTLLGVTVPIGSPTGIFPPFPPSVLRTGREAGPRPAFMLLAGEPLMENW